MRRLILLPIAAALLLLAVLAQGQPTGQSHTIGSLWHDNGNALQRRAKVNCTPAGICSDDDVNGWTEIDFSSLGGLTEAQGSIIIGDATPEWSALAIGAANAVLLSDATTAAWDATPAIDCADCTNTIPSHNRSEYVSAWAVNADGTNCADPAGVTIGSGPIVGAVACADNDASTIYFNLQMPDNYDGGTITIGVQAVATSATPSGDLDADVSAFCENDSGAIGSDWGTEIALDVTFNTQNDLEMAESAAVTPTATCQAGSHLFARYQVDAAGTDGTITSQILGFSVGYNVAADDLDEVD